LMLAGFHSAQSLPRNFESGLGAGDGQIIQV